MSRHSATRRRLGRSGAVVVALGLGLTGCAASDPGTTGAPRAVGSERGGHGAEGGHGAKGRGAEGSHGAEKVTGPLRVTTNVEPARAVAVDTLVQVSARSGALDRVEVRAGEDVVAGRLRGDRRWQASSMLEPGRRYQMVVTGTDAAGDPQTRRRSFHTDDLTLDEQTYPSFYPEQGDIVGVGMPAIVRFDVPVQRKAAIERHLSVDATPAVTGTWHWYSDYEVHFRPKTYWKPGTKVSVHADINGVDAGNGIYGQLSRSSSFSIGDSVVSRVDLDTHRLAVRINGKRVKTIPITGGDAEHKSRSGTKVIMEKFRYKDMDAATTGVAPGDPGYYNIDDVEYAMRVTYSGEFLHAAPWSVDSQGSANVSHGCIGMSTADAGWLYRHSSIGDVVVTTGSNRSIEPGNGWSDWDESYAAYKQGSALG